ncbi:hypothetical protein OSSY52_15040 [Tepiditoga spiralis]|uniref:DUF2007 domain-containing protein n=1 Tax=Tepiditoga spiralis TaxID=2108365 RepID=A0A7G1G8W4_9BACT|nr:DUF2007 domain-containing protein [Tepiditoga spiralis]BBE31363.1 hypothetical protein OSSY52_15040 [Tepiditoga spiralis]
MKKLIENVEFFKAEMIKQILENEGINPIIKSTSMIGSEYMGYGIRKDLYINEKFFEQAKKILNDLEISNKKEDQNV